VRGTISGDLGQLRGERPVGPGNTAREDRKLLRI
jgi:hypothetical protein